MPLRLIPDNTNYPFMKWAKIRTPISLALIVLSFVLFFTVGLNVGIDFKGGTVIEIQSSEPVADIAAIREKVGALEFGDVQIQGIGQPNQALIL
jgi:preprotein translocase subunit SecF